MGGRPDISSKEKPPKEKKAILPSQSYGIAIDPRDIMQLAPLDNEAIEMEKKALRDSGKPPRMGLGRFINASMHTHGEWHEQEGDKNIWLFGIHSPSALGIRVHFTNFFLLFNVIIVVRC